MSLTSHLRDSNSPVTTFFLDRFPNTRDLAKEVNARAAKVMTIDTPGLAPWEYGLIGTAFDYRVRYFFAITPYRNYVAYVGAANLGAYEFGVLCIDGNKHSYVLHPSIQDFFESLEAETNRMQPVGGGLKPADEERLARYCLVLALLEQVFRAGLDRCTNSPLVQAFAAEKLRSPSDFLALCRDNWVSDMQQLTKQFLAASTGRLNLPAILNPTFEGSRDVGGADADLILGNTLVDIKAKKKPNVSNYDLYQLLGYVLLDYSNHYNIGQVGFYLARQGIWHMWSLDKYLTSLGAKPPHDLNLLRAAFRTMLASRRPS